MSIGSRIRFYRIQKGMTQKELGNRTLISDSTISLYENDVRPVPAEMIITICKALDVTPNTLLGFDPAGNKQKMMDEAAVYIGILYDKYMK